MTLNRRAFLFLPAALALRAQDSRPRVAAVCTEFRHRSHADVICTRILDGYYPNGRAQKPRTRIVSMYLDQVPPNDMGVGLASRYGYEIRPTIPDALTAGGSELAVDAVLLIGEHGDYPTNELGQKLYPRYELFEQIVATFRRTGRSVPVFCDKHLSYSWEKARRMYDWSRELGFPFMAGSSIPVTVRTPELEIPFGARVRNAVQVGYGGTDAYGFHTLEAMQAMLERRAGGETGVESVEFLSGEAVWRRRDSDAGRWSAPLLEEALRRAPNAAAGRLEDNAKAPEAFWIRYRDGLEAAAFLLNGHVSSWTFAAEVDDRIVSTHFGQLPEARDLPHFDGLTWCVEELFTTGKPVYPVERTLLTTGMLAFAFESKRRAERVATPELAIRYETAEKTFFQRA